MHACMHSALVGVATLPTWCIMSSRDRSKIYLKPYIVDNAQSTDSPGSVPHCDDSWNFKSFKKHFRIDMVSLSYDVAEFDMIGLDPAIANAIRRVLIAEVPTMAIEKVFIHNNTSIIQDEVLAHRFGLIPIFADPRKFMFLPTQEEGSPFPDSSPQHMLEFKLKVKCTHNPKAPKDSEDPNELYHSHKVTTDHIKWTPIGEQAKMFSVHDIRPVHNDILIAKLRPGQEIDVRLVCTKGLGKDHAKFSPVATASYRLLPEITLTQPVVGPLADKLARCFPKGVIKVQDISGQRKAVVANARKDTCSREVLRHEDLKDCVELSRIRDHFIFSVESTGALSSDTLVLEALRVLMDKCSHFLTEIDTFST